jgi:hypothetical protein
MLSVIAAPETAPQTYVPLPAPPAPRRLDPLDKRLLEIVKEEEVVQIWYLLNKVGDEETNIRGAARTVRLALWDRLKRLIWLRLVWRHGKAVACAPPSARIGPGPRPRQRVARTRTPTTTVRPLPGLVAVSTGSRPTRLAPNSFLGAFANQLAAQKLGDSNLRRIDALTKTEANASPTEQESPKPAFPTCTDSAMNKRRETLGNQLAAQEWSSNAVHQSQVSPNAHQISQAARALARLPRRKGKRRWSGWLDRKNPSTRIWRGRRIILPDGEVCFAYGCLRNKVVWSRDEHGLHGGICGQPFEWGVMPASEVRLWKNPHAASLGHAKLGIREKPSLAKQNAARTNGLKPTRPGRRRGRRPVRHTSRT